MTFSTPGYILYSLAIPASVHGLLSCMFYGNNDKSSWQIFHAVVVENWICCTKCCTLILTSCSAMTTSVRIDMMCLHPLFCHIHFLFLQTTTFHYVVSRWCNMNRKLSTMLSLKSNTKLTWIVKGFDSKHFLTSRIWHHLVIQFTDASGNKQTPIPTYELLQTWSSVYLSKLHPHIGDVSSGT
jgi:hypothetical protein